MRNSEDYALEPRVSIGGLEAGRPRWILQMEVSYVGVRGNPERTLSSQATPSTVREGQLRQIASLASAIWH
jgi:hypothetical protein